MTGCETVVRTQTIPVRRTVLRGSGWRVLWTTSRSNWTTSATLFGTLDPSGRTSSFHYLHFCPGENRVRKSSKVLLWRNIHKPASWLLYCVPNYKSRYGFANVLLILGAVREIRLMLVVWIVATLAALIWEFVLLSILFSYDTTIGLSQNRLCLMIYNLFSRLRGWSGGNATSGIFSFLFLLDNCLLLLSGEFISRTMETILNSQELTAQTIKEIISGKHFQEW